MRQIQIWLLALCGLVLTAFFASPAFADGFIVIPDPGPIRYPVPFPHYVFAPLEVRTHRVTVEITDQVAQTEVDEIFYNPNDQRLEGTYMFPIPKGAQIDKFSMDINGKMTEAELLDADKARAVYEDIVRRMKDPALLEYVGQGMFQLRIYPIEPRSEKRIKISYTELLRADGGVIGYVYPLNTEKFSSAPLQNVSVTVNLQSQKPLRNVYSPSHTVEVKHPDERHTLVGYEDRNVKPDTDFQLFFSPEQQSTVGANVLTYNDASEGDGGYFLLLASAPTEAGKVDVVKKDVIFVLDTSGSMAENGKLDQAKRALQFCLKNLNSGDRFNIVRFSTDTDILFEKLSELNNENSEKAERFISGLKPSGGTAIEPALLRALQDAPLGNEKSRPYLVVFLTDGMPTVGMTDADSILNSVKKKIGDRTLRIFSFGIGTDVNTKLLDKLTEETNAASTYVLPKEDIEVKVSNFYRKISDPVLSNLTIGYSNAIQASKMLPSPLPDLFKGEELIVLGRYQGHGNASITIQGTLNGESRSYVSEATFPEKATENAFIPKLWATRRVGFLLDQIRLHGDNKELRDEVTDLARKYGIVTPYTAYLIVEDEVTRNVPVKMRMLDQKPADYAHNKLMYEEGQSRTTGRDAVGSATSFSMLKGARNFDAEAKSTDLAMQLARGTEGWRPQDTAQVPSKRYIRGRTFYRRGTEWIDSSIAAHASAKRVQITFNSPEYYAFMKKHPDAAQWLSVGKNVQIFLDDTIYEIVG